MNNNKDKISCYESMLSLLIIVLCIFERHFTVAKLSNQEESLPSSIEKVESVPEYGVDCSFPMHYEHIIKDEFNPLGTKNRVKEYKEFIGGCDAKNCRKSEKDRVNMNLRQPPLMKNYTSAGYAKMSAPAPVSRMLREVWNSRNRDSYEIENWSQSSTYVNHWESDTFMIQLPKKVEESIVQYVQPIMERWIGGNTPLILTSIYGIRVYEEGAVLAPHVDRLPLVTSCILQVAQDVEEDWPLEVIDHSGRAVNITAYPGDMILCRFVRLPIS